MLFMCRAMKIYSMLSLAFVAVLMVSGASAFNAVCQKGHACFANKTIAEIFTSEHFERFFPMRNNPLAHANFFWNYHDFLLAASTFEPLGFGTTGGDEVQKTEIAAFLAHVAHETTCMYIIDSR